MDFLKLFLTRISVIGRRQDILLKTCGICIQCLFYYSIYKKISFFVGFQLAIIEI